MIWNREGGDKKQDNGEINIVMDVYDQLQIYIHYPIPVNGKYMQIRCFLMNIWKSGLASTLTCWFWKIQRSVEFKDRRDH